MCTIRLPRRLLGSSERCKSVSTTSIHSGAVPCLWSTAHDVQKPRLPNEAPLRYLFQCLIFLFSSFYPASLANEYNIFNCVVKITMRSIRPTAYYLFREIYKKSRCTQFLILKTSFIFCNSILRAFKIRFPC